jgi:hypothetical protein
MGKKKALQEMKPEESGSFLAGQVQPTAPSKAEGIQKAKQIQEIKRVDQLIKMQKGEIIGSIQYYIEDTLSQIAKEYNLYLR